MRRMGYYPALSVILLLCGLGVGAFVFLTMEVAKKIGSYKSSDEVYATTVKQLEDAKAAQRDSEKTDKMYTEYLTRWAKQEGQLDEPKLKQKFQKIAEAAGVKVLEVGPLGAGDREGPPGRNPRGRNRPTAQPPLPPEGLPQEQSGALQTHTKGHDIELKVTLLGPFGGLMSWLTRAEGEIGGLRIISTSWMARSPEEVRLSVGLRCKIIGELP